MSEGTVTQLGLVWASTSTCLIRHVWTTTVRRMAKEGSAHLLFWVVEHGTYPMQHRHEKASGYMEGVSEATDECHPRTGV